MYKSIVRICPRCKKSYANYPSLSRRDNQTDICDDCGMAEAMEDAGFSKAYTGPIYWQVEDVPKSKVS